MLSIKLIMPPAVEPVTLDEAKTWLKLETADEDATLTRLIASARQMVEQYTRLHAKRCHDPSADRPIKTLA